MSNEVAKSLGNTRSAIAKKAAQLLRGVFDPLKNDPEARASLSALAEYYGKYGDKKCNPELAVAYFDLGNWNYIRVEVSIGQIPEDRRYPKGE